jgi:hypothetical protein
MATLGSKLFSAVAGTISKASRGSVSGFVIGSPHQFGQPLNAGNDVYGMISPKRMREIMLKTPTASACVNAILDFTSGVKVGVRNIDASVPANKAVTAKIEYLLCNPNPQDTWQNFVKALFRDLLIFGYAGVEIESGVNGGVANLWVLDNERIGVDYDEHGTILGFTMMNAHGQPIRGTDNVHAFAPNEVIWFRLDAESSGAYGKSRTVELFAPAVLEGMMLNFIGGRFTDSNIPFGLLDLGDITVEEQEFAIESWNQQSQKAGDHRIILTGSKGGAKWMPFGYHLKDLDATGLLNIVKRQIMGILGVTMNELGESEDINKANGYNLSFVFKKRAIEPLLRELTTKLTTMLLHRRLGLTDLELYFDEIDSRDELLQAQIDDLYFKVGVWSTNFIRNRKGLPSVAGGDDTFVFTGRDWVPLRLLANFAEAQLQSLWLVNAQIMQQMQLLAAGGQPTEGGASIMPPQIKPPVLPEMESTPNTAGHEGPTIRFPSPQPKAEQSSQRPRGAVQNLRNAGVRKEDQ